MDDLISRQVAMDCCFKPQVRPNAEIFNALKMAIRSEISALQSVDAAPVTHGRWEEPEPEGIISYNRGSYAQCSVCKKKSYLGRADKYCRYCGAKMDLEE